MTYPHVDTDPPPGRETHRVFEYRTTDRPGSWCTVSGEACTLEEMRRCLLDRYRERLIEVRPMGDGS